MKTVTFNESEFKLVPIEPTETMVVCGFESRPDPIFSKPEEWEAFDAMTGCQQAAHKARLCYAAMLAAAPTPPASAQDAITVSLDPDPRGVSVGVWQGSRCIYNGAHAVPAPVAGDAQTEAARDVLAERHRQITAEGWTPAHDDAHADEQLARAAACYALPQGDYEIPDPPEFWPWDAYWWKPGDRRRELIKAGALILAEIERLDRAAIAAQQGKGDGA